MADLRQQFSDDVGDSGPDWWRRAISVPYLSKRTPHVGHHFLHFGVGAALGFPLPSCTFWAMSHAIARLIGAPFGRPRVLSLHLRYSPGTRSSHGCDIHYLHYPPATLSSAPVSASSSAEALETAAAAAIAAAAPSVVFLHGTAAHAQWYQHIAPFFAADGFT